MTKWQKRKKKYWKNYQKNLKIFWERVHRNRLKYICNKHALNNAYGYCIVHIKKVSKKMLCVAMSVSALKRKYIQVILA